jgi:hypothetical protein
MANAKQVNQTIVLHIARMGPYRLDIRSPIDFTQPFTLRELPNFEIPCVAAGGLRKSIYGQLSIMPGDKDENYDMRYINEVSYPQAVAEIVTMQDVVEAYGELEVMPSMNSPYRRNQMNNFQPNYNHSGSNVEAMRNGLAAAGLARPDSPPWVPRPDAPRSFGSFPPPSPHLAFALPPLPDSNRLSAMWLASTMHGNPDSEFGHSLQIEPMHGLQLTTMRSIDEQLPNRYRGFRMTNDHALVGNLGLFHDKDRYDFRLVSSIIHLDTEFMKAGQGSESFAALRSQIGELIKEHFPFIERHASDIGESIYYYDEVMRTTAKQ